MKTYKLTRIKGGKLYPLFVESNRELPMGVWLDAGVGEKVDENHVRARGMNTLSLRPGWHSCSVPFADWIGKRGADGKLYQRPDTVWCECQVEGEQVFPEGRYGLRTVPHGWYYFRTQAKQPFPWIISDRILIKRVLDHMEVEALCRENGIEAQKVWEG